MKRRRSASNIKTIRNDRPKIGRNSLCPCGSGSKFKKCCGKPAIPKNPVPFEYRDMRSFYTPEQTAAATKFSIRWGFVPNPEQLRVAMHESDEDQVNMIIKVLQANKSDPRYIEGVRLAGMLATNSNEHLWSPEDIARYIECMRAVGFYNGPTESGTNDPVPDAAAEGSAAPGSDSVPRDEVQGSSAG